MLRKVLETGEAGGKAASSLSTAISVGVRFTDVPGDFRFHAVDGKPRFETGKADEPRDQPGRARREGTLPSPRRAAVPFPGAARWATGPRFHLASEQRWVRYRCTSWMLIAPSPTAEATRLIEPCRTSPAANTPGRLVSSGSGGRAGRSSPAATARSWPVRMKPWESRWMLVGSHWV